MQASETIIKEKYSTLKASVLWSFFLVVLHLPPTPPLKLIHGHVCYVRACLACKCLRGLTIVSEWLDSPTARRRRKPPGGGWRFQPSKLASRTEGIMQLKYLKEKPHALKFPKISEASAQHVTSTNCLRKIDHGAPLYSSGGVHISLCRLLDCRSSSWHRARARYG